MWPLCATSPFINYFLQLRTVTAVCIHSLNVSAAQMLHQSVTNGHYSWPHSRHGWSTEECDRLPSEWPCMHFYSEKMRHHFISQSDTVISSYLHKISQFQTNLASSTPAKAKHLPLIRDHGSPNWAGHESQWRLGQKAWLMCAYKLGASLDAMKGPEVPQTGSSE